ncbi:hypothetical protein DICSQDRAFT_183114 [Dichomitus squalens LYAD-421 SS1]|uniref:Uncharacterized protein n=1 Tax=Dichomitus squalens (strain LYAD-421) TaxID=732165 RepID=R7SRJ0_DICSQ|nr:uncharacterized protein DICSQDRAFT_183114 [Dichomitus squalens LYAD-421 SS1]EJF57587.1 hypothetical protein DICSQDRAFT_183114 [Dichomitus squalens LYAD-421 SS1]
MEMPPAIRKQDLRDRGDSTITSSLHRPVPVPHPPSRPPSRPPYSMDTLPLETLQRVFQLACTDGGHTGCALSLTSKAVRAAARVSRFHSVGLVAHPDISHPFLTLYERERVPAVGEPTARIAHLSIAFPALADASCRSPTASHRPQDDLGPWRPPFPRQYLEDVRRLFHLIAPDLRSLVLCRASEGKCEPSELALPIFSTSFPMLHDVSLFGLASPRPLLALHDDNLTPIPLFPSAKRLELAPGPLSKGVSLDELAWHAPCIAELRLSNLQPSPSTIDSLAGLAKVVSPSSHPDSTWDALRTVTLRPCAPPPGVHDGWCGDAGPKEQYTGLWRALQRVRWSADRTPAQCAAGYARAGTQVVLPEGRDYTDAELQSLARRRLVNGWEDDEAVGREAGRNCDGESHVAPRPRHTPVVSGWQRTTILHSI